MGPSDWGPACGPARRPPGPSATLRHVPQHPPAPPGRGRRARHHRRGAGRRPPVRAQGQSGFRTPSARTPRRVRRRRRRDRRGHGAAPARPSGRPWPRARTRSRIPSPAGRSSTRGRARASTRGARRPRPAGAQAAPPMTRTARPADSAARSSRPGAPPGGAARASTSSTAASRSTARTSRRWLREHGAPLFVYDLARPRRERPRAPGARSRGPACPYVTRFALKACPDPRILAVLRGHGRAGHARRAWASTPARRAR